MIIIDPPVTPFSEPAKIREWIAYLRTLGDDPEVLDAIRAAESWLEGADA